MSGPIRFPFRLNLNGAVATSENGSEAEVNDAIAAIAMTFIGERPMNPGFGVTDPVGMPVNDVDMSGDIQNALSTYGFEDVTVESASITPEPSGRAYVVVEWERDDPEVDPIDDEEEDDE